jgi:2-alkenal reductase
VAATGNGTVARVRPGAVAAISLIAAVIGGVSALALGETTGWVGGTETVIVGSPQQREGGDPTRLVLEGAAEPLVSGDFKPARIYAARADGVVTIYALFSDQVQPSGASQGSGFVVSADGLIMTNSHVITSAGESQSEDVVVARTVYVQFRDGERVPAKVVGWDPFTDVAVVKVARGAHSLKPVPLGDSTRVVVGQPVAAIGSPFGNHTSLSVGVVSATNRSISSLTSIYNVVDAIQTDTPINRGNSGGPLFDSRGRVIGVNAQIRSESGSSEGVGFAIPINSAKRSLEQLVAHGEVSYAYVGVKTTDLTPRAARRFELGVAEGAIVTDVSANSPAARAGLRGGTREVEFNGLSFSLGGDVIVAINGKSIRSADDVVRYVTDELAPGDVAVFTVVRDRERRQIAVRMGERRLPPR